MKSIFVFLSLFLVRPASAQEIQTRRDIPFGKGGALTLRLHLLRPKILPKTPLPVVIYLHGGAWQGGSADKIPPLLEQLARKGFAAASVEFRGSKTAIFPAQIEDVKCAVRFLRLNAKNYSLDGQKIGVWGVSTGGHLAALVGTSGGAANLEGAGGCNGVSSRVQAVAEIGGPSDFLGLNATKERGRIGEPIRALLGGSLTEKATEARFASPTFWVSPDDPPFLILHGDADSFVPISQSERLFQALKKAGVEVSFRVFEGQEHALSDSEEQVAAVVTRFFEEKLKK